jgi:hypothetical protein
MHSTNIKVKFDEHGQLIPATTEDAGKLKMFFTSVKKGSELDAYITVVDENQKTLGQLAKVHAMIRELANFTGHNFQEMKREIKSRAGLCYETEDGSVMEKSFADCSKVEISAAIMICIEIGDEIGYYMS